VLRKHRSEDAWSQEKTPTDANLYGVAIQMDHVIAVGEHGAIVDLPSQSDKELHAVPSGTKETLRAVAFSYLGPVAVGDHGTLLVDTDGSWTAEKSGTTETSARSARPDGHRRRRRPWDRRSSCRRPVGAGRVGHDRRSPRRLVRRPQGRRRGRGRCRAPARRSSRPLQGPEAGGRPISSRSTPTTRPRRGSRWAEARRCNAPREWPGAGSRRGPLPR